MTISGGRTEQLDIIAGFLPRHCFTSNFLSFIVAEHIRFFHGALQLVEYVEVQFSSVKGLRLNTQILTR